MELVQEGWGRPGKANPTRTCQLQASLPAAGNASRGIRKGAAARIMKTLPGLIIIFRFKRLASW